MSKDNNPKTLSNLNDVNCDILTAMTVDSTSELIVPITAPSNPVAGSLCYDNTNTLHIYNGTEWKTVTLT